MNEKERNDIIISWLTVSFAFAWIGTAIFSLRGFEEFISQFIIMLFAVGTGFIFHELAHRQVAKHYGAHAEFRAWKSGLLLALGLAIITNGSMVFAAPGAVYVFGKNITIKQNGIISLAGPATNILIAIILGMFLAILNPTDFIVKIIVSAMYVNFFLAAFNMIPIFPLDGSKVIAWNALLWGTIMLLAASGVFFFNVWLTVFSFFSII